MTVTEAEEITERFDSVAPLTIGLEEELLLVDPETLVVAAVADEVLDRFDGDERVKGELPAAQVELVTEPAGSVAQAIAQLATTRTELAERVAGLARPIAAGVHPFAPPFGELSGRPEYAPTREHFGPVIGLQQVSALQIHIAVGGAERTLAVHNALRSYLPEITALAANAPLYAGRDTGMATVRPVIARTLPRQGIPPAVRSWAEFAQDLRWGRAAGGMPGSGQWWWDVRPHPGFGTLEVRAPDAQATIPTAAAVAAFVHCLVALLADRFDAGELADSDDTWRIEENRWSAAHRGSGGSLADLTTGERYSTRECLHQLIGELAPFAARLGCTGELELAHELADVGGWERMRIAAGPECDPVRATRWLADVFVPEGADAR